MSIQSIVQSALRTGTLKASDHICLGQLMTASSVTVEDLNLLAQLEESLLSGAVTVSDQGSNQVA